MSSRLNLVASTCFAMAVAGCGGPRHLPPTTAPDNLPLLARVSDGLYRGAQPTPAGFRQLKEMGVRTIVSLRVLESDRDELAGNEFRYLRISFKPFHPEEEDVLAFLKVATDPCNQPVFVHCRQGIDRTGMMVACYRMVVQGWTSRQALAEMKSLGFTGKWDEIQDYIERFDVARIKRKLPATPAPKLDVVF